MFQWRYKASFVLAIFCVVAAGVVYRVAGTASAQPGNHKETRAYLLALYSLTQAEITNLGHSKAFLEKIVGEIKRECPGVRSDAPQNWEYGELGMETIFLASLARSYPDRHALLNFARTVKHLHWSDPQLDHLMHLMAVEKEEPAKIILPDICLDMKRWVTSGYHVLPADTKRFLAQMNSVESHRMANPWDMSEHIARMLAPYESRSDKAIILRTQQLLSMPAIKSELSAIEAILPELSKSLDEKT